MLVSFVVSRRELRICELAGWKALLTNSARRRLAGRGAIAESI